MILCPTPPPPDLTLHLLGRVKLVEKEKNELEGPMKEAVGHLRTENDRTHLQNRLIQKQIMDLDDAIK